MLLAMLRLPIGSHPAGNPAISNHATRWQPLAAFALFAYALSFSLSYASLNAGTGALLLFGTVQITMLAAGLRAGERPSRRSLLGMLTAVAGVVWLVSPGVSAPDPIGAMLMVLAGAAWGTYSLLGRGTKQPTLATARNFLLATPLGFCAMACAPDAVSITATGAWLAAASGAITSGLGYALWYAVLPRHSATTAAVVQLSVPVITALLGITLLHEAASLRLLTASVLTLGGVVTAIAARK